MSKRSISVYYKDTYRIIFFVFILSYTAGCIITPIFRFNYLDELCVLTLVGCYCKLSFLKKATNFRVFKCFIALWIVYAIQSIWLGLIEPQIILLDMIQLSKPFLAFICVYEMAPVLSNKDKKTLNTISLLMTAICLFSFLLLPNNGVGIAFHHISIFGKFMLLSGLMYLYTSKKRKKNLFVFFSIVLLSILCFKSRAYVEAVLACMIIIFVHKKVKFSFKYITLGLLTCLFMIYVAWSKINVYFGQGITETSSARSVLYITSFKIAKDYFPLGTGFGSYGNDASRVVYSPVYDMYGISGIWGLSRIKDDFIADTFFPCVLGEFGYIGLFLFVYFFYFMFMKLRGSLSNREKRIDYCIGLIIIGVLILESIAGPTLVTAVGIPYVMLIGFIINEFRYEQIKKQK